ncbi:CaiB/BaiF CoA transferase family protein [Chloroflexota bacterium]
MTATKKRPSMLQPYRVLDLTDEKGFCCGRMLGDMGADVIKIERPGGDASRSIEPFYHDIEQAETSLYWFAFNANKRGITLNIETAEGQEIFKRLVERADFVIESFTPGYLDELGLDYSTLSGINPRIILTSITPFGQTGPYAKFKGPDIVCWALSGYMYLLGDPDRPPVRISYPHAYVYGGAQGAAASLIAHYHRERTGRGQHIDASIQEYLTVATEEVPNFWLMNQCIRQRAGPFRKRPNTGVLRRLVWPCKDGHVVYLILGGRPGLRNMQPLVAWMDSEGLAPAELKETDWNSFNISTVDQEILDAISKPVSEFFQRHTMAELSDGARDRGIMLYGVSTVKNIIEDTQLSARDYWTELEHPELGTSITYPNAFAKFSEADYGLFRRAPLIGEHNEEIYVEELGYSMEDLGIFKQKGVI